MREFCIYIHIFIDAYLRLSVRDEDGKYWRYLDENVQLPGRMSSGGRWLDNRERRSLPIRSHVRLSFSQDCLASSASFVCEALSVWPQKIEHRRLIIPIDRLLIRAYRRRFSVRLPGLFIAAISAFAFTVPATDAIRS